MRHNGPAYGVRLDVPDIDLRRRTVQYLRAKGIRVRRDLDQVFILGLGSDDGSTPYFRTLLEEFLATEQDGSTAWLIQVDDGWIRITRHRVAKIPPDNEELKESVVSDRMPFCEMGSILALNWMRIAAQVVEQIPNTREEVIQRVVQSALEELVVHRLTCDRCGTVTITRPK